MNSFVHGGMTARGWRMIAYACVGFFIYGAVFVAETLQNYSLNRIDRQMQQIQRMDRFEVDNPQDVIPSTQPVSEEPIPSPVSVQ